MNIILTAQEYSFHVGKKKLLDKIAVHVTEGDRLAIIGPNGAGKSTLLKSMMRIIPYGDGDILVNGKILSCYKQKELAKWLSYVPQFVPSDDLFTVREYMLMGRFAHLSPLSFITKNDRGAVSEALDMIGMSDYAYRSMNTLSGGEQQKILIGTALVQGAKIMLLDEPVAFLDPKEQAGIYRLLEDLHDQFGITLVEVTHDVNRAAMAHDRIVGLRQGRVVFDGTSEALMTKEALYKIYHQDFKFYQDPEHKQLLVLPGGPDVRVY